MTELLGRLDAHERLAAAGALAVAGSLFLPWYAPAVGVEIDKTGFGDFGFAQAALLLTVSAAVALIVAVRSGYALPKPMREGTLLAAAGTWAALLVAYRMADRPEILSLESVRLRYGIFVAVAGAVLIVVGGLRKRREELRAERTLPPSVGANL